MHTTTDTETLVACPDCGQANILPRGLVAHRNSGHCARERDARASRLPAAPGEMPETDLDPSVSETFAQARIYRDGLRAMGQGAAVMVVLLGTELKRLHKAHGVRAGRPAGNSRSVSVIKWADLVASELGLSDDTARNYMALADAARQRLPEFAAIAEELLSKPLAELPEIRRVELAERTRNILPSDSAQQLSWDWGIAKRPVRKGGKTYERENGAGDRKTLSAEQIQTLLHTHCLTVAEKLAFLHKQHAYTALNDAELIGLRDHCEAVAEAVKNWQRLNKTERAAQLAGLVK